MTAPKDLNKVWAISGGLTDPDIATPGKYEGGWVSEIPTYQNFNYVLNALDNNMLALAERSVFPWQDNIAYKEGCRVERSGKIFTCITAHNSSAGSNVRDPNLDTTNSYWVYGIVVGNVSSTTLTYEDGLKVVDVNNRTSSHWNGSDITVENDNATISLKTSDPAKKNWLLTNVDGEVLLVDVGTTATPDARDIRSVAAGSHKIYHEGNKPTQADVANTIPANPEDGKLYGRQNSNWVQMTSTTVQSDPPPPVVGNGQGWYNLEDGTLYVDINDGDSSQWVPSSPAFAPNYSASDVDCLNSLGGDSNVQAVLDSLAGDGGSGGGGGSGVSGRNLLINGDFKANCWQRGTTFTIEEGFDKFQRYTADRWQVTATGGNVNVYKASRATFTEDSANSGITLVTAAGNSYRSLETKLESEDVGHLYNKQTALQFIAVSDRAATVRLELITPNSTDEWAVSIVEDTIDISIAAGETKIEHVFAALGTNVLRGLGIRISIVETAAITFSITNVQLEEGDTVNPYQFRSVAEDFALCQRYYCILLTRMVYGTTITSDIKLGRTEKLPVQMRVPPSMEIGSFTTTNFESINAFSYDRQTFDLSATRVVGTSNQLGSGFMANFTAFADL